MKQDVVCVSLLDFFEGWNVGGEGQSEWPLLGQRERHFTDADRSRIQRTEIAKFLWGEDSETGGRISWQHLSSDQQAGISGKGHIWTLKLSVAHSNAMQLH